MIRHSSRNLSVWSLFRWSNLQDTSKTVPTGRHTSDVPPRLGGASRQGGGGHGYVYRSERVIYNLSYDVLYPICQDSCQITYAGNPAEVLQIPPEGNFLQSHYHNAGSRADNQHTSSSRKVPADFNIPVSDSADTVVRIPRKNNIARISSIPIKGGRPPTPIRKTTILSLGLIPILL